MGAWFIFKKIEDKGYTLTDIWITHWHGDHTNAVDDLANKTGAKITAGINEVPYLNIENPIHTVADGDMIKLGNIEVKIIETPGHTAGGFAIFLMSTLLLETTLFVLR